MYVIEVLPLSRGVQAETLSYFSHTSYKRGTLLSVPVRSKEIPALVISVTEAFSMKAALRAATFSLRRLPPQEARASFSEAFIETAEHAAEYHATTTGMVLTALLPKEIREGTIPLSVEKEVSLDAPFPSTKPLIYIAPEHERFHEYKRMVRESFANRQSVLFVVPTLEHLVHARQFLEAGIEAYTITLASNQSLKSLRTAFATLETEIHPLLIVTTPQYASLERHDTGMIILEHERSQGYVGKVRPYLDYRRTLRHYASKRGMTLILGDTLPRTEEMYLIEKEKALYFDEEVRRIELQGVLAPITIKKDIETPFLLFTDTVLKVIKDTQKQKKRSFIFSARRGLSPIVACIDCGEIMRDPESGAPVSLHRVVRDGVEERWLTSVVSGFRVRAYDKCPSCGSWRLRERGVGIQQVHDELVKHVDRDDVILFDHLTASTFKKATALRDRFYARGGTVLLGTALALPYLEHPVDASVVVSMDSLRSIPSWRGHEESLNVLLTLREKTRGRVFVQTRTEDETLAFAAHGTIGDFYTAELAARKEFRYPPYMTFIHLSWREKDASLGFRTALEKQFAPYGISLYSAFDDLGSESGKIHYALMRISEDEWPHKALVRELRTLPPAIRIVINPDRII